MSQEELNDQELNVDDEIVDDQFDDNQEGDPFVKMEEDDEPDSKKAKIAMPTMDLPELTRKDKTLNEILDMMDDYAPIIPDAVIDYYMTKNGLSCGDSRIKRLIGLATQKFISDIATDAYEYSRIRSSITVYNSNNSQARARALVTGQPASSEKHNGNKVVLTMNDLSSAVSEYGLNITRPDFYR